MDSETVQVVVMIVAGLVVLAIVVGSSKLKRTREFESRIRSQNLLDDLFVSMTDSSYIGIDFAAKQIILGEGQRSNRYSFSQITSIAVVENGSTITSTNRGSQLLGGAVGAIAFGGVGAVVGALTGSTRSSTRVQSIYLRVTVDDSVSPIFNVCFRNGLAADSNSLGVKDSRGKVERFHAHLLNAMRQAETGTRIAVAPPPKPGVKVTRGLLNADGLQQLWDMKQQGILTEDEFNQQKARMLE